MTNELKIEYKFEKIGLKTYRIIYSAHDTEGTININDAETLYHPRQEFANNNQVRNGCYALMNNMAARTWEFRGKRNIVCNNPKEDFLPKNWRWREATGRDTKTVELPLDKPMGPVEPNACVYEVVQADGGVWTIVRHTEPYYTQEQAKVELFKRIVNG